MWCRLNRYTSMLTLEPYDIMLGYLKHMMLFRRCLCRGQCLTVNLFSPISSMLTSYGIFFMTVPSVASIRPFRVGVTAVIAMRMPFKPGLCWQDRCSKGSSKARRSHLNCRISESVDPCQSEWLGINLEQTAYICQMPEVR